MGETGKGKLLYIMGIDWDWIFQRPQIIERHLEENYDVTVVFPRSILKIFSACQSCYPQHYRILWTLPLQERIKIIGKLSWLLNHRSFRNIEEYGMVVIGFPLYYRYIPRDYPGILIYDCMDNHEALYPYHAGVEELLRQEQELASTSRLVFTSSQMLMKKLQKYNKESLSRMVLLRNGVEIPAQLPDVARPSTKPLYKIGYIGTIAEWFDMDLLLKSLKAVEGIEYHLIGPSGIELPDNEEGIIAEGIVPHDSLYEVVQPYSCLVMPFQPNETVLYVDPVKLYEYIAMGKCIIAVYYPEIERFKDFVYFYRGGSDYIQLLTSLKKKGFPPKYTSWQRRYFLEENSWQTRFSIWDSAVRNVESRLAYDMHGGEDEH